MTDETYNGWTNRETWAVALHINNDQGWQESVHEALRAAETHEMPHLTLPVAAQEPRGTGLRIEALRMAGDIIRENVETTLEPYGAYSNGKPHLTAEQWGAVQDIGSLWRVNWAELGAAFLDDLREE